MKKFFSILASIFLVLALVFCTVPVCAGGYQPIIEVLYPNGGQSLEIGKTYNIIWRSSGLAYDNQISEISLKKGNTIFQNIVMWTKNDGLYRWTVPSTIIPGDDYKIYIEYSNSSDMVLASDSGDNYFSIVNPPQIVFSFDKRSPVGMAYPGKEKAVFVFNVANQSNTSVPLSKIFFSINCTTNGKTQTKRCFYLYDEGNLNPGAFIAKGYIQKGVKLNNAKISMPLNYKIEAGVTKTFLLVGDTRDFAIGAAGTNAFLQFFINSGDVLYRVSRLKNVKIKGLPLYGGALRYSH